MYDDEGEGEGELVVDGEGEVEVEVEVEVEGEVVDNGDGDGDCESELLADGVGVDATSLSPLVNFCVQAIHFPQTCLVLHYNSPFLTSLLVSSPQ